jgi:GTP 3',8-cyclase
MTVNTGLTDAFGRRFYYLRLSVTDVCNFRCSYCLPNGYAKSGCDDFLSLHEITRLATAFSALGMKKIRLTGGEPTLRPDFTAIARSVSRIQGIQKVAVTTNGYRLRERAAEYASAGIQSINISIDSLRPEAFSHITGHDRLDEIMEGVSACRETGFQNIKINTVLLKGVNDSELDAFIDFVVSQNVSLRFIELMRTLDNKDYFTQYHVSSDSISHALRARGWQPTIRAHDDGPAVEYMHPGGSGRIGVIAPYGKDFCQSCNRLRVSARGNLHLCLFGEEGFSLRRWLQHDEQLAELQSRIVMLLQHKRAGHGLHHQDSGATPHLASIGG